MYMDVEPQTIISGTPCKVYGRQMGVFSKHVTAPVFALPHDVPSSLPQMLSSAAPQVPSLPPKVVKKILDLEFIDMSADTWRLQEEESRCCHHRRGQRRGPVKDILIWIECYSSLISTLTTQYPQNTP